jgi:hypothetical protein
MGLQRDVAGLPPGRRIDHRQRALAVADDDPVAPAVEPDVVGIVAQRDRTRGLERIALIDAHRSVAAIGDPECLAPFMPGHALRRAEALQTARQIAGLEVDDADAVVPEFGHEQALTLGVVGGVIDPAGDSAERDLGLELQRVGAPGGAPVQRE